MELVHGRVEEDGTKDWTTNKGWTANKEDANKGWTADKDWTTLWSKTNTARIGRRTKVRNPRNSTLDIILAVKFERDTVGYRAERTSLTMKGSLGVNKKTGLFRERNNIPPLRTVICKEQNPKTHKLGLLIHKRKNTKVIGREPRGVRGGCESAESEPKKSTKSQAKTVRKSNTKEAGRWNSKGDRNLESEKKKVEALREETVTAERFSGKEGSKTIVERTRRTTKAKEVTKSHSCTEGGEPRNLNVHRTKVTVSASTNSDREAERLNMVKGEAKQLTSKPSGIYKPNLNRYKSILSTAKELIMKAPIV